MKRGTKVLALTSAVVVAASLAACDTGGGTEPSGDGQTLTIIWEPGQRLGFEPLVQAFEAANPDVTVNITWTPSAELYATLATQLSAGTAPDIVYTEPGSGRPTSVTQLLGADHLVDLSNEPWAAGVPDGVKANWSSADGRMGMFATSVSSIGAIYNDDTLAEIGGEIPETWSQVLELCDIAKAQGRVAYALGGQTTWVNQGVPMSLIPTLLYRENQDWNEQRVNGETTFADTPGWVETMEKYKEMFERGCFNESPAGTSLEQSVQLIADREAAGVLQVAWYIGQFQQAAPNDSFSLAALPATEDPSETILTTASISGAGINAHGDNIELAKKFVAFMAEAATSNAYTQSIGLAIPSIPNDEFDYSDPNSALIRAAADAPIVVPFMDQGWPNPAVKDTFDSLLQTFASSNGTDPTPIGFLEALDQVWDS